VSLGNSNRSPKRNERFVANDAPGNRRFTSRCVVAAVAAIARVWVQGGREPVKIGIVQVDRPPHTSISMLAP